MRTIESNGYEACTTKNTQPIPYDRLMEIAKKLHLWIFLHTGDEFAVYKELGLTDAENIELGSIGKVEIHIQEAQK